MMDPGEYQRVSLWLALPLVNVTLPYPPLHSGQPISHSSASSFQQRDQPAISRILTKRKLCFWRGRGCLLILSIIILRFIHVDIILIILFFLSPQTTLNLFSLL